MSDDDCDDPVWKTVFFVGAAVVGLVAVVGHFASSCEASKHRMVEECLRTGHSGAECKLLEMGQR